MVDSGINIFKNLKIKTLINCQNTILFNMLIDFLIKILTILVLVLTLILKYREYNENKTKNK